MATPKIQPLGSRVLIKATAKEEVTASGIVLPDTMTKERPQMGEVLAVGPGGLNKDGVMVPVSVKVGQKVYFAKYGPTEIKIDNQEYLVVEEKDILATVDPSLVAA